MFYYARTRIRDQHSSINEVNSPPQLGAQHGNWIVPSSSKDFFGPPGRTITEIIINQAHFVWDCFTAPILSVVKPNVLVSTPRMAGMLALPLPMGSFPAIHHHTSL
jgi:hypothetical protein